MNTSKIILSALLLSALVSCKKKDDTDMTDATTTTEATTTDTLSTSDTTNTEASGTTGKIRSKRTGSRELTTAEIDSIKAERDKIVTPPSNTGASGTPGSGRAVPSNNKIAPGNNASQGSSTGNVEKK